ncbi:MAG: hypothetical protein ACLP01_14810 [Solirubrobacteraceae bacterium]
MSDGRIITPFRAQTSAAEVIAHPNDPPKAAAAPPAAASRP